MLLQGAYRRGWVFLVLVPHGCRSLGIRVPCRALVGVYDALSTELVPHYAKVYVFTTLHSSRARLHPLTVQRGPSLWTYPMVRPWLCTPQTRSTLLLLDR